MFFRIIILLCTYLTCLNVGAQNNLTKEQIEMLADSTYAAGNYNEARQQYSFLWARYENYKARELIDLCNTCIGLLSAAMGFERDEDFNHAIECYDSVLAINPKDPNARHLILTCKQKQYAPLINQAKQLYREGKYIEARDKLREYTSISGQTDEELLNSITECLIWSDKANEAMNNKNYDIAKIYLGKILSYNSTDVINAQRLADVNSFNQKVQTVFVKETTKKSLRPFKNKFNYFIYSGFSYPITFGGGIGFNVSYFHLSFDCGGSLDQPGIEDGHLYDEYIKNCVKINENTYVQGRMQLAVTPAINLKYFGLGVGFGTMMTKELSIKDRFRSESLYGDESNKTRLLVRPTINGFIPFDSDYTVGFMVMAGYNIVSGVSGLNQFILGIGMFF